MCDELSGAVQQSELPESWDDVLQFAAAFFSVMRQSDGTIWVRRGAGDLLHVLGFYAEQHPSRNLADRLTLMSEVLKHIADNLDQT